MQEMTKASPREKTSRLYYRSCLQSRKMSSASIEVGEDFQTWWGMKHHSSLVLFAIANRFKMLNDETAGCWVVDIEPRTRVPHRPSPPVLHELLNFPILIFIMHRACEVCDSHCDESGLNFFSTASGVWQNPPDWQRQEEATHQKDPRRERRGLLLGVQSQLRRLLLVHLRRLPTLVRARARSFFQIQFVQHAYGREKRRITIVWIEGY